MGKGNFVRYLPPEHQAVYPNVHNYMICRGIITGEGNIRKDLPFTKPKTVFPVRH